MLESLSIKAVSNVDFLVAASGGWDIENFLKNSTSTITTWFGLAVVLIGIVMIAFSIWQIASGLMSGGKKQTSWGIAIVTLILGGALSVGGFVFVQNIAKGGKKTIEQLGGGTVFVDIGNAVQSFFIF